MSKIDPEARSRHRAAARQRINAHVPTKDTRDMVKALVYLKTAPPIIAKLMQIDRQTLSYHYYDDLRDGAELVAAQLGMMIIQAAIKGDKGALGQIARAQGIGRQEQPIAPPQVRPNNAKDEEAPLDLSRATDTDLARLLEALAGGAPSSAGVSDQSGDRPAK